MFVTYVLVVVLSLPGAGSSYTTYYEVPNKTSCIKLGKSQEATVKHNDPYMMVTTKCIRKEI